LLAVVAQLGWRVAVTVHRGQPVLEIGHVQPDSGAWSQRDLRPADVQQVVTQRLFQAREGAAQVGPRGRRVVIGPEQRGERVAIVGLAGRGQVGDQGQRLAPDKVNCLSILLAVWRAEQMNAQLGHDR